MSYIVSLCTQFILLMLCISELILNLIILLTTKSTTSDSIYRDCSDNIFNVLKEFSARVCSSRARCNSDNPLFKPENIITV